jgi:hypothetical protein
MFSSSLNPESGTPRGSLILKINIPTLGSLWRGRDAPAEQTPFVPLQIVGLFSLSRTPWRDFGLQKYSVFKSDTALRSCTLVPYGHLDWDPSQGELRC